MMTHRRPVISSHFPTRFLPLVAFLGLLVACSDESGGFGSCIEEKPFPPAKYDKMVARAGDVKITQYGVDRINEILPTVVRKMLKNPNQTTNADLEICLSETKIADSPFTTYVCPRRGSNKGCSTDPQGCPIGIDVHNVSVAPQTNSSKAVLSFQVKASLKHDMIVDYTGDDCEVYIHKDGNKSAAASIPIAMYLDIVPSPADPKTLTIIGRDVDIDFSDLGFHGNVRFGCLGIAAALNTGLFDNYIRRKIKESVPKDTITDAFCASCDASNPCKAGSYCHSSRKVCIDNSTSNCVAKQLFQEGGIDLRDITSLNTASSTKMDFFFGGADEASSSASPGELKFKVKLGAEPVGNNWCAKGAEGLRPPIEYPRPSSATLLSGVYPLTGDAFPIGAALHKDALNQVFWSAWSSGVLCMQFGQDQNRTLSSNLLSLLFTSLRDLTVGKDSAMSIKSRSVKPPRVALGPNKIEEVLVNGAKKLVVKEGEGLLNVTIEDFIVTFYVHAKDVDIPLFDAYFDLKLPIGLMVNDDESIEAVLGDFATAINYKKVELNDILAETNDKLDSSIPKMIELALQQMPLQDFIPNFSIPEVLGLHFGIDKRSFQSVDGDSFLGIFLTLSEATNSGSTGFLVAPTLPITVDLKAIERHAVDAALVKNDLEIRETQLVANAVFSTQAETLPPNQRIMYRYRVNHGPWSNFWFAEQDRLVFESPLFKFGGAFDLTIETRDENGLRATASTKTIQFNLPRDPALNRLSEDLGSIDSLGLKSTKDGF